MELGFLEHLDASHSTVIVIADPLPHLQHALASGRLKVLLDDLSTAGSSPSPQELSARLELAQPWIPAGIAIGLDDAAIGTFVRLMVAVVQWQLCQATHAVGPASVRDDLPRIQAELATSLEAMVVPSVVVRAKLRGADEAGRVFESLAASLGSLDLPASAMTRTESELTIAVSPADLFDRPAWLTVMVELGVTSGDDDPMAPRLVDAILGLRATLTLVRSDTELVLALRPTDAPTDHRPLAKEQLGSLFDANAVDTVMWARWNGEPATRITTDAVAMLDRWEDTEVGRRFRTLDVEDLAGDIRTLQRELQSMSTRGQLRISAGDRLEARILAEDPPPAVALGGSPLLGMIPSDASLIDLDGTHSLADRVANAVTRFEVRLARTSLQHVLRGDEAAEAEADARSLTYYTALATARDLMLRQGPLLFEPPQALVMTTSNPLPAVEMVIPMDPGPSSARIPVPELALIGKPRDMAKASAWIEDTASALIVGSLRAAGLTAPTKPLVASDIDLGLGVPTRALHLDSIASSIPGLEVAPEPGVSVHFFAHGDFLVVSTSARLSRELLRTDDEPLTLQDPATVGWGRLSGKRLAVTFTTFVEGLRPTTPDTERAAKFLAELARAVGMATWRTTDGPAGRLTEVVVSFEG